jgi:hypothetical protein
MRNIFHPKLTLIKVASRTTLPMSRMRQRRFVLLADRGSLLVGWRLFLVFVAADSERSVESHYAPCDA